MLRFHVQFMPLAGFFRGRFSVVCTTSTSGSDFRQGQRLLTSAYSTQDRLYGQHASRVIAMLDDLVDQAKMLCLIGCHEVIAIERFFDQLVAFLGVLDIELV